MGIDYIKSADGGDVWASITSLGFDLPIKVTIGDAYVTLDEFLAAVKMYLSQDKASSELFIACGITRHLESMVVERSLAENNC